jgi:hypothetical protein
LALARRLGLVLLPPKALHRDPTRALAGEAVRRVAKRPRPGVLRGVYEVTGESVGDDAAVGLARETVRKRTRELGIAGGRAGRAYLW